MTIQNMRSARDYEQEADGHRDGHADADVGRDDRAAIEEPAHQAVGPPAAVVARADRPA